MLAGGILLLPAAVALEGMPPGMTAAGWSITAWLAAAGTALAFAIIFGAMHHGLTPVSVSRLMLLCPLVATAAGWTVYRQSLTPLQLLGAALVLTSVAAVCRPPAPTPAPPASIQVPIPARVATAPAGDTPTRLSPSSHRLVPNRSGQQTPGRGQLCALVGATTPSIALRAGRGARHAVRAGRHAHRVGVAGAVATGAFSAAVLVANSLRDVPTDQQAGKVTLAVRLGERRTRILYCVMVAIPFLVTIITAIGKPWLLAGLLAAAPLAPAVRRVGTGATGLALIPVLRDTALAMLVWAAITAAALAFG